MIYRLEMRELTDAGEPTGKPIELARVDTDGEVTGAMAATVRQILKRDKVRLGLAGEFVRMQPTRAWLVAYALTMTNCDLQAAGYARPGTVFALTEAGEIIPMPERYLDNLMDDVIDTNDPTHGIEHTTA